MGRAQSIENSEKFPMDTTKSHSIPPMVAWNTETAAVGAAATAALPAW